MLSSSRKFKQLRPPLEGVQLNSLHDYRDALRFGDEMTEVDRIRIGEQCCYIYAASYAKSTLKRQH